MKVQGPGMVLPRVPPPQTMIQVPGPAVAQRTPLPPGTATGQGPQGIRPPPPGTVFAQVPGNLPTTAVIAAPPPLMAPGSMIYAGPPPTYPVPVPPFSATAAPIQVVSKTNNLSLLINYKHQGQSPKAL